MKAAPARVHLLVLNWNQRDMLSIVLPSLERQTFQDFAVTVVDNGSEDDSVEYVRREWPQVDVLALPENIGFAPANNAGIRATTSEFVGLLNNDIELDPRWLELMIAELARHPEAGSAGCKLLNFDRRDLLDGAGDVMNWRGLAWRRGFGELDRGQYDRPEPVFGACAAAAIYRRATLDHIGPLDDDFYIYLCDCDWSLRAHLAGYTCRYVPDAVAYHVGGGTNRARGDFELFHVQRNNVALVLKNYPARSLLRHGPVVLFFQLAILALSVRDGKLGVRLRAWGAALGRLPDTLRKRRRVQRLRRVPIAYLDSVLGAGR